MSRKFIATIVSAALLVTTIGNAPARADEDLARLLATVVGVAIVGGVIKNKLDDDDDDKRNRVTRQNTRPDGIVRQATPRSDVIRRADQDAFPRRGKRFLLPGNCLRSFQTNDGRARVFGKKCLKQNYAFTNDLPRACKVKFRANGKKRQGYGARCLRRSGYQLARR